MRAYELLYEHSDQRSTVQKLRDVIDHPATEPAIRAIAQTKLSKILQDNPEKGLFIVQTPPVRTNLALADMDRPFIVGVTIRQLYDRLCALQPGPCEIQFTRQGQIYMMVPPPFQGVSKQHYHQMVNEAAMGVRRITSSYIQDKGYMFVLSYI